MTKAVIFDMYETLITHYNCPLYFGGEMAADAGVSREEFFRVWRNDEYEWMRTVGNDIGRVAFNDAERCGELLAGTGR